MYGFNKYIDLTFKNLGMHGGWAKVVDRMYAIEINNQLLCEKYLDEAKDTLIHEFAHIVCFWDRSLGRNHNKGWKKVCRALGGTGNRCHSVPLKPKRKTRVAIYNVPTPNGNVTMPIGLIVHGKINKGQNRWLIACRSKILPEHFTGKIMLKSEYKNTA